MTIVRYCHSRILRSACTLILLAVATALQAAEPQTTDRAKLDDFETLVRPLLLRACGECHGEQRQKGGLRLDARSSLLTGGESGPALVPGKPEESLLISAVKREGLAMPPNKPLTHSEVAILERWIRDGAVWPTSPKDLVDPRERAKSHWAFLPPVKPAIPAMNDSWGRTPVDGFIAQRWQQAGLAPSPPADRRTLIRRVTYDLTGLPPSPAEVEAFVADPDPQAYEKLVEKLLDSPHYGEQWARHWLDVARYSDTKGYVYAREERFLVQAAPYRDWVVRALQNDLPFDRFLLLQLAADQVSDQPADLAAMGLLTVGRRFLGVTHDIIDDRIDVVMRGMMGLTVGCARCHNHKYDPIPTADYYALYGVFQNCTERLQQIEAPAERSDAYVQFEQELNKRQQTLADARLKNRDEAAQRVRERVRDYLLAQLELPQYPEEGFDQVFSKQDILPNVVRRWHAYLERRWQSPDSIFGPWQRFAQLSPQDFASQAARLSAAIVQSDDVTVNPRVRALFSTPPASPREVVERYGELLATVETQWKEHIRQASTTGATALPAALPEPVDEMLRQVLYGPDSPCLVPDEPIVTTEYFYDSGTINESWKLQGEVERWILNSPVAPAFAVAVVDRQFLTEPRILKRGNPANKGDPVPRRFLSLFPQVSSEPFQSGSGRRELAEAVISPANPLTARVWVNRVWMHHFGVGLVDTPSDFGIRAGSPSHPELLDWLATTFMEQGWSTKRLHRLIVLSATYQQASTEPADPTMAAHVRQVDPENRLLSRMSTRRLTFEEMRDTLLVASDELDRRAGGKASDLLAANNHRRTLYGLIDRQFVPGVLRVFDFANPDLHIAQRSETTVPQQALFLLNHPFLAARARGLARRSEPSSAPDRVRRMFAAVYQREPTADELQSSLSFLASAESEPVPQPPVETTAWQYGVAGIDPAAGTLSGFQALPYFTGSAWQGSDRWPDGKLGWAQLTATGGHPGNDLKHAVVRRWTAPAAGSISVDSLIHHEAAPGDGIRYWILSSRDGVLKTATIHQKQDHFEAERLEVQPGDTLDFVVDILEQLHSDQYLWKVELRPVGDSPALSTRGWVSDRDFHGPRVHWLTPWEQFAQVLLSSNELMFVD